MTSFYGGRRGESIVIVKHFDSIADMVEAFSDAGYTDVSFGQYVIIDTIVNSTSTKQGSTNKENGIVYRRGLNYTATKAVKPTAADYTSSTTGLDEVSYLAALNTYFQNPGCGAEYIGKIIGPMGDTPKITGLSYNDLTSKESSTLESFKGEVELETVSGKTNDTIKYAWCNYGTNETSITDEDDLIDGAYIAFQFPYPAFEFSSISISAYEDPSIIEQEDSANHPYYWNYQIKIPKGIKGDSLTSIDIEDDTTSQVTLTTKSGATKYSKKSDNTFSTTARTESRTTKKMTATITNYDESATGVSTKTTLAGYKTIASSTWDEDYSELDIVYTDGTETKVGINAVDKLAYIGNNIVVHYSDPEYSYSNYIIENNEKYEILGAAQVGICVAGDFETVDELNTAYPSGITDSGKEGWLCSVGQTGSRILYAWDYKNKKWYPIGDLNASSHAMLVSAVSSGTTDYTAADAKPQLDDGSLAVGGYWFIVEEV